MPPSSSTKVKGSGTNGEGLWSKPSTYPQHKSSFPLSPIEKPRLQGSQPVYYDDATHLDDQYGPNDFQNAYVESPGSNDDGHTTEPPIPAVVVRGEEIGIVIVVLLLWIGAIALFFNRWGKIRMLEPYQPKFCESHRPSCPIADVPPIPHFPRTLSKFNLSSEGSPHFAKCNNHTYNYHSVGSSGVMGYGGPAGASSAAASNPFPSTSTANATTLHRPYFPPISSANHRSRQNSVFSPAVPLNGFIKNTSRKTKSAVDLSNLILSEKFVETARRNSKNSITHL